MNRTPSLTARLTSIVLGFEALVMFMGGLTVYGLKSTPAGIEPWWAVVGGGIVMLAMIVAAGCTRFRWGIGFGWVLQALILACAVFNLAFIIVFVVCAGMWLYVLIASVKVLRKHPPIAPTAESE